MFFSNEKNIDNIHDLFILIKEYLQAQKELAQVNIVEKLTLLLSAIAVAVILMAIGTMALLFLVLALANFLEPIVGGIALSYGIIVAVLIIVMILISALRARLIYRPITRFLAHLFMDNKE